MPVYSYISQSMTKVSANIQSWNKSFSKAIMKNLNHGTFKWGHRETFKVAYGNIIKIKNLKMYKS